MKNIFLLFALISLTIFSACEKQGMEDDFVPANQEPASSDTDYKTDNFDFNESVLYTGNANFKINNEDNTVFEREALSLTNNSVKAVSYHWDFGNGDTSTEAIPNYKYRIHGNYTVTLTITDPNGDKHQASHEITVLCLFGGGPHDQ